MLRVRKRYVYAHIEQKISIFALSILLVCQINTVISNCTSQCLGKFCITLRDKEKHNIKKSQTNHAGKWVTVHLAALSFVGNKHLGFPGHRSPRGVSHSGQDLLDKSNLSPLGRSAPFRWIPGNAQLPLGTVQRWASLLGFDTVNVLNVLIEKVIFGNILGINWTLDNKFSPHCASINYFNQIYEVLFGFETSHKFSVIWRPGEHRRETTLLRTLHVYLLETFRINKRRVALPGREALDARPTMIFPCAITGPLGIRLKPVLRAWDSL